MYTIECIFIWLKQENGKKLKVYRVLSSQNGDPAFQALLASRVRRIDDMISTHSKFSGVQKAFITEFMSGGIWNMYKWWANHEDEISTHDMALLINRIRIQIYALLEK